MLVATALGLAAATVFVPCRWAGGWNGSPIRPLPSPSEVRWFLVWRRSGAPERWPPKFSDGKDDWRADCWLWSAEIAGVAAVGGLAALALRARASRRAA